MSNTIIQSLTYHTYVVAKKIISLLTGPPANLVLFVTQTYIFHASLTCVMEEDFLENCGSQGYLCAQVGVGVCGEITHDKPTCVRLMTRMVFSLFRKIFFASPG